MLDWNDIKSTDAVYPQHEFSILVLQTDSGKPGTGWINKAYEHYLYKEFCPYNFLIMVDLTEDNPADTAELDMGTIEDYFVDELRKICIAHIVARIVTDVGLNIEMYLELLEPAMEHLQVMGDSPKRLVPFFCEINDDPKWEAVSGLMNIASD